MQPVWCGFDGSQIVINTAIGRAKDKNMRADTDVTVLAVDPDNVFRWIEVRGKVAEITTEGQTLISTNSLNSIWGGPIQCMTRTLRG